MHGGVAAGAPAGAAPDESRVIEFPDGERSRPVLYLGMTAQAKVVVSLEKELLANRSMGGMADGAALPHGLVLEDKRTGLILVTLGATFVAARHGQAAGRLEDVVPVGIMALHTIHAAL